MANPARQLSQRQRVKTALERIESLEINMGSIIQATNQVLNQVNARLSTIEETLAALVIEIGPDQVQARVDALRTEAAEARMKAAKDALDKATAAGDVVKSEAITEKSLIVGVEKDKDGKVIVPGRVQLTYTGVKPEFQTQLLGKGIGTIVKTTPGGTFEVTEVYDIVEKAPEAEATPASEPTEAVATETPAEAASTDTAKA